MPDDQRRLAYLHRVLMNTFLRGQRRKWLGEVATADLPHHAAVDETEGLVLRASVVAAVRGCRRDSAPSSCCAIWLT